MADKKQPKNDKVVKQIEELTLDLQRTRADFENYRKRVEQEKSQARQSGEANAIMKLLPTIDNIERAISHVPNDLVDNAWVSGVVNITKQLDKSLEALNLKRIEASAGTTFDPELHEAVQFDEESEGTHEIIAAELQAGYLLNGQPIRHSMVKVTKH